MFSEHLACLYDDLSFDELEPRSFSFNSPFGACPDCTGLGTKMEVDPELIVPDPAKSLDEGAIAPWAGGHVSDYFGRLLEALAETIGFRLDTPWEKLPAKAKKALLHGHETRSTSATGTATAASAPTTRTSRARSPTSSGGTPRPSPTRAGRSSPGYMREVPCPSCQGDRLKPISLAVTLDDKSIADYSRAADRRAGQDPAQPGALRPRDADRRAHTQGGQRPARLPARRRPRLPLPRPGVGDAGRWRGAADQAGHPDRLRPGRRALRARRAVHRAAPARQPAADRDAAAAARPRQHADRGRARRGHHPRRRLGRRHRPGRGRARRPGRRVAAGRRAASTARTR